MKNSKLLLILTAIALINIRCSTVDDLSAHQSNDQLIYFQYEYVNNAWGRQHTGWLIDSLGNVYSYNRPEEWNNLDSLNKIDSEKFHANLEYCDSILFTVDKTELFKKIDLIPKASQGKISDPVHEMYDAGITTFSAFILNSETNKYECILLIQYGDFRRENDAAEANELYNYLEEIRLRTIQEND